MRSRAMRDLDRVLRTVAHRDVVVTLIGESGTGKEVLARRIHELSGRAHGPFVPINCAAIPEALFESELFGHERGAFTGASERARGKIEAADGGTLFLDEIGEMPIAMQAKLLRFLEGRRFMRVGGTTKIAVDVRLVCATLRPLELEVQAGRFRGDLYYRLQGISLRVPPLRERLPDIPPLLAQLVAQVASKHGTTPPRFTRAATAALLAYPWPGNVRELRNVVEMMCLLREGAAVRARDLPAALQPSKTNGNTLRPRVIEVDLAQSLDDITAKVIAAALALEGGNRSRTADRLGISVRTLQRHLRAQG